MIHLHPKVFNQSYTPQFMFPKNISHVVTWKKLHLREMEISVLKYLLKLEVNLLNLIFTHF